MSAAPMSPVVPKPAHVPDGLVYDYDAYRDPELLADPSSRIARMVKEAPPVFWTPRNGGQWVIQGYEALFNAYRDPGTFSSSPASAEQLKAMAALLPPGTPRVPQARPISLDPPEHTQYRAPLQKTFSPKAALALKDEIRKLANELIDAVADRGRCDFMPAVAEQLPVRVFIKMFGLPLERHAEYRMVAKEFLAGSTTDAAARGKSLRIIDVMRDTIVERRDHPKDDILSMLWQTTVDGRPTTLEDMEDYAVLLFIAGLDTVVNGMGLTMRHLATHPSLQEELRRNPQIIPEAVEEMLRRYTFTVPVRRVAKDVLYEGAPMKAGEWVLMYDPAADLDPKKFRDPQAYDLHREDKTHIAFGAGPHRCLGSHLARVEMQIATEVVLSRLANIRCDPEHPPRFHGGHVIGPESLPLLWDVSATPA
ncbi:MAG TPA: cytochrome P450 [Steroidobacteraceae bacterium]|nr:cytochrome P450 [Steroidobacteraceae bacterium]